LDNAIQDYSLNIKDWWCDKFARR